jgi:hypothetical protein
MKQVTLNIPENKYDLFMEFIKNIEFIKKYNEININVSEEEQAVILDRIKNTPKADLRKWSEVKDSFNL